jgi:hypothetical protein
MITDTRTTERDGFSGTTFIEGICKLEPIETYQWPEDVLKTYTVEDGTIEAHYYARIEWSNRMVYVVIGDYILAEWKLGVKSDIVFSNDKGYGPKHFHSYLTTLPVSIVSDIVAMMWPKM